jgi:hypothetical protein
MCEGGRWDGMDRESVDVKTHGYTSTVEYYHIHVPASAGLAGV